MKQVRGKLRKVPFCPPTGAASSSAGKTKWLKHIHRRVAETLRAACIEGMDIKRHRYGQKATRGYSPFEHLTVVLFFVFANKHQLSGVAVNYLFAMLRYIDGEEGDGAGEGRGFDVNDVPNSGEHFVSRMWQYLPLLELWMSEVERKSGKSGTASVYDIPTNLILETLSGSKDGREEEEAHSRGVILRGDQAAVNGFMNDQVAAMATRPVNSARRTFMHGRIAAPMPLYSSDAILTPGGTPVYISDFVMVDLLEERANTPLQVPCRVVKVLSNAATQAVDVVMKCFRTAWEVLTVTPTHLYFKTEGMVKVFEELGPRSEITLQGPHRLLDPIKVITAQEPSDRKHLRPWGVGEPA